MQERSDTQAACAHRAVIGAHSAGYRVVWAIYDRPIDFPNHVVARMWLAAHIDLDPQPTHDIIVGRSVEEVRMQLPGGLLWRDRTPGDEPRLVETWAG